MFIVRHHQSYNIRFVPEWNFNEVNNRCFLGNYVRKMRSHLPECLLGRSVHYTIVQYSTLYRQGELWVPKTRLESGSHLLHLGPGVWCHLLSQHLVQLVLKYQKKMRSTDGYKYPLECWTKVNSELFLSINLFLVVCYVLLSLNCNMQ